MSTNVRSVDEASASVVFGASSSLHPIRSTGSATGWCEATFDGGALADANNIAGHLKVPVDGLSSGNPLIDVEMRRRLDAGTHPTIVADLESVVEWDGARMMLAATIDFFGVEVLAEGEVTTADGPNLMGTADFDVRGWSLEPPRMLMLRVDPIVTVDIDLPLVAAPSHSTVRRNAQGAARGVR